VDRPLFPIPFSPFFDVPLVPNHLLEKGLIFFFSRAIPFFYVPRRAERRRPFLYLALLSFFMLCGCGPPPPSFREIDFLKQLALLLLPLGKNHPTFSFSPSSSKALQTSLWSRAFCSLSPFFGSCSRKMFLFSHGSSILPRAL